MPDRSTMDRDQRWRWHGPQRGWRIPILTTICPLEYSPLNKTASDEPEHIMLFCSKSMTSKPGKSTKTLALPERGIPHDLTLVTSGPWSPMTLGPRASKSATPPHRFRLLGKSHWDRGRMSHTLRQVWGRQAPMTALPHDPCGDFNSHAEQFWCVSEHTWLT